MIFDVAIIGAGAAGAGLAAELAPHMSVLLLEAEDQPGYHSTGRSNALWHQTYGGPGVEPLTRLSRAAFDAGAHLMPRGAISLARAPDAHLLDAFMAAFAGRPLDLNLLDRPALETLIPGLLSPWVAGVFEPDSCDIDVAGYHAACLAVARRSGALIELRGRVEQLRREGGCWVVQTQKSAFHAARVVNAAGAWADEIAKLAGVAPLQIQPYRRTIVQLRLNREVPANVPFLSDVGAEFYFRPEGNLRVWLSPFDETPTPACDAAAEELDIAIAVDRFQRAVDWPIAAVERSWAGLRSFAPDRLPVFGWDKHVPDFFWCAGQGGFGIQTAPAAAHLCAALIREEPLSGNWTALDPAAYATDRLTLSAAALAS